MLLTANVVVADALMVSMDCRTPRRICKTMRIATSEQFPDDRLLQIWSHYHR